MDCNPELKDLNMRKNVLALQKIAAQNPSSTGDPLGISSLFSIACHCDDN
jgi:hypothetical protein